MRVHITSECLYADSPQLFCGCCAQTFHSFAHLANHLNAPGAHKRKAITTPTLTLPTSPTIATTTYTQTTYAHINMLTSAPNTLPTQLLASPQASPLPTLSLSQTQLVDEILSAQSETRTSNMVFTVTPRLSSDVRRAARQLKALDDLDVPLYVQQLALRQSFQRWTPGLQHVCFVAARSPECNEEQSKNSCLSVNV